jgi:hypothetical protein
MKVVKMENSKRILRVSALVLTFAFGMGFGPGSSHAAFASPTRDSQVNSSTGSNFKEERVRSAYERKFGLTVGSWNIFGGMAEIHLRPLRLLSFSLAGIGYDFNRVRTFGAEFRARIHPFSGPFLFGVGAGYMVSPKSSSSVEGLTLTPHVGWTWVLRSGFTIGTEAGVMFADVADPYARAALPYIAPIKIGYMF